MAQRSQDAGTLTSRDAGVLTSQIAALRELTANLTAVPIASLEASEATAVHDGLRYAIDQLRAFGARLLAHIEADGRWATSGGSRTFPEWVAKRGGTSVGSARREAVLGKALGGDLPLTRAAVAEGRISLEHAQVLSQFAATSPARRVALASDRSDRNEAFLVAAATRVGVDEFRRLVRRWAAAVDEAAFEAEHTAAIAREHLHLTRRPGGVDVQGFLAAENADTLATALAAVTGVPAANDTRTPEQRRAAALTDLARLVLDRGLTGSGASLVRPHINVTVSWQTMQRLAHEHPDTDGDGLEASGGPAELDDGEPIPPSVFERIACDSEITRVVFGPTGQPLDVGRARRTYTGAQRHAVITRDQHCQYPGCDAPPVRCEVHHIRWWSRGGPTSVSNGILVCWYHHDVIHQSNLTMDPRDTGGWEFRERDGRLIHRPGGVQPPGGRPEAVSGRPPGVWSDASPGPRSDAPPGPRSGEPPGPRSGEPPGPRSGEPPGPRSNAPPRAGPGAPPVVQDELALAG